MSDPIRVGTRRSTLARAQTDLVIAGLIASNPGIRVLPVPIVTSGDRTGATGVPLDFTDAIDAALAEGSIDLAVHSAKDLPARLHAATRIVAILRREDPRDCLVLQSAGSFRALRAGARIGSSSLRRRAQLLRARPDLQVVEMRGNVDSRISHVRARELDGIIVAAAGMRRLGRGGEIDVILDSRRFLPAPGQGALAVTARANDRIIERLIRPLDHPPSRAGVVAEREFSRVVGGDCNLPLAALGSVQGGLIRLRAEVLAPDGRGAWAGRTEGSVVSAVACGRRLAADALRAGAARWIISRGVE